MRASNRTAIKKFSDAVWSYYRAHGREMPWRTDHSTYAVVVSEIMLQQTQVSRVTAKFASFVRRFPDWKTLAKASTKDVISEWSGLGYNRRALYLKKIAEAITDRGTKRGMLPKTYEGLRELPGIGPNTAGSILAFAYNIPHPFIETNIRSVFIHHFFAEIEKHEGKKACKKIDDGEIMPLIQAALALPKNQKNPREWHYALMDYGADLKKRLPNPSRRSAHHVPQSSFKGSNRELRAKVLRLITKQDMTLAQICNHLNGCDPASIKKNLEAMRNEGFFIKKASRWGLA